MRRISEGREGGWRSGAGGYWQAYDGAGPHVSGACGRRGWR